MAILIQLSVIRGIGVEEILPAADAVNMLFNTQYMVDVQQVSSTESDAKTTFRYADPSSGRGADQVDVTNPYSTIAGLANA